MNDTIIFETEGIIIAEMLKDEIICAEGLSELSSDDFSLAYPKIIFESMVETFQKGEKVDAVTIQSKWKPEQKNELKQYLFECSEAVVSLEAYREHIKALKNASTFRRARAKTAELYDLFSASSDIELLQEKAGEVLREFDKTAQDKGFTLESCFNNFIERIGCKREYIETGIKAIDKYVKIEKGDFIIIGGRPSTGKTALTLQMALKMAESYKVVYFSFETAQNKLFDRIMAFKTMTDFSKIKSGELNLKDKQFYIENYSEYFKKINFKIVNAAGMNVTQIQSNAIAEKADIIFIDYLGLINIGNDKLSNYEKTSRISVMLHTMAQSLNIAVFALCQLHRGSEREPGMEALRDSGQIEQDADAIILLARKFDNNVEIEGQRDIRIVKNKDGETVCFDMTFQGNYQRFSSAPKCDYYVDIPFPE